MNARILIAGLLALGLAAHAAPVRVKGVGRAPADRANAREQALADALRDAVRKGAGVDLVAQTQTRDLQLEYDRVFASAFGHVRDYRVTDQYIDELELYNVEVEATVEPGAPDVGDLQALRMIVRLKESPRVRVEVDEQIDGVTTAGLTAGLLTEMLNASAMQVVDVDVRREAEDRRARRDALVGAGRRAEVRRADVTPSWDFLVRARVRGRHAGTEKLYGMATQRLSLGVDLTALWADTGEVVAQVTIPSFDANSGAADPSQAARAVLQQRLRGEKVAAGTPSAVTLLRRIVARWVTELDLGTKMQLEFDRIDRPTFDAVYNALRQTEGIGAAWVRSYDGQLLSMLEVESRLNANQLKDEVLRHLGGRYRLDRHERQYLQFVRLAGVNAPSGLVPSPASTPSTPPQPRATQHSSAVTQPAQPALATRDAAAAQSAAVAQGRGIPPWVWGLGGFGAAALLFGVFLLGARSGGRS